MNLYRVALVVSNSTGWLVAGVLATKLRKARRRPTKLVSARIMDHQLTPDLSRRDRRALARKQ